MKSFAAAAVAAALLAAVTLSAQQQQPLFKSGAKTVAIFATVIDANGRLVPGLQMEDFEVLDEGKPVELTLFDNEVQPFTAAIALDTSGSMTANISRVQEAAEQFVIRMLPDDKAAVVYFNDQLFFSPRFTTDRDDLSRYIRNEMRFGNATVLWDAVDASMDRLERIEGRKVVVALTDGDDYGSKAGFGDVRDRARSNEVMVYSIGFTSDYFNGARQVRSKPSADLKRLAQETGGGFFELEKTADLNTTFTRVIQELHSQYAMAFQPERLDGKLHKLLVRVKKPGMTARARQSYLAK
ncbi:MAG TPA: VWA domain-containing protein [Vicinamibacterales bacterium]|nr:VWA domain-containing protein [Vicinamibacterales bacterium]